MKSANRNFLVLGSLLFLSLKLSLAVEPVVLSTAPQTQFAVIGDYGDSDSLSEEDVANLVKSWKPEFIITLGDNNYPNGAADTIDENIGKYYHSYIGSYHGKFGKGSKDNRFFPSLGNHDWNTKNAQPYLDYFTLYNNERYYDFVWGPVHFFAIDSDEHEPDGKNEHSIQAQWLKDRLASSTSAWKIVYFHHPPYCSGEHHGSDKLMRWPFKEWGADLVLTGHEHLYERLNINGLTYIACGLSGNERKYAFGNKVLKGSMARYNADWGALKVFATDSDLKISFINLKKVKVDSVSISKSDKK